jgi:hypothetical protein
MEIIKLSIELDQNMWFKVITGITRSNNKKWHSWSYYVVRLNQFTIFTSKSSTHVCKNHKYAFQKGKTAYGVTFLCDSKCMFWNTSGNTMTAI